MGNDLRERLEALSAEATQGEWTALNMVHADGRPMTPQELGEYVKNSVQMSAEERFLFVSGNHDGKEVDICHVGNGPKGPANARLIEVLVNAFRSGDLVPRSEMEEAVANERESCAAICDAVNNYENPMTSRDVADVIRARSEQKEGE